MSSQTRNLKFIRDPNFFKSSKPSLTFNFIELGPGLLMETVASPMAPPQQTPHHSVEAGVANEASDIKDMDSLKYANGPHQVHSQI